jgi:glutathione S-transferase
MTDLILHHYDRSPFSEKVRLIFGVKGLAWRSVIVPMTLPKPRIMPLTGGYRRTPVLQVGADIYCDTGLIAAELERRCPAPAVYPAGHDSLGQMLVLWADRVLFWPTARYVTGKYSDRLSPEFHADRAAMRGLPTPTAETLRAAMPHDLVQMQIQVGWVERLLGDGRAFLLGEKPGVGDFAAYARLWWLGAFDEGFKELAGFPAVQNWMARLAAFGHGDRTEMSPEEALDAAAAADPAPPSADRKADPAGPPAGARVRIANEDADTDPVDGAVLFCGFDEIVVTREDPRAGTVAVHFPRLGYRIRML